MLTPDQWSHGKVVNHENSSKLTVYLVRWANSIESIELDALLNGYQMTLTQLKHAVKEGTHAQATLREFVAAVIDGDSSRCKTTKRSYHYLVNELEKEYGSLTIQDVTYDLIVKWREVMRTKHLSENTIKGRLKALRCLLEQARLRKIITENPFENITIGNIGGRVGGLTMAEVNRLERLELSGQEEKVRDLFLLGCYTALRWGDLSTLEEAEIKNGMLRKMMHKTHHEVCIPIGTLFWGRGMIILSKYPDITELSHCCCNTTANRVLKEIAAKAHIKKRVYFHLARKTCGQLLNSMGMSMPDISSMLGHSEIKTTKTHYVFSDEDRVKKIAKKIFK